MIFHVAKGFTPGFSWGFLGVDESGVEESVSKYGLSRLIVIVALLTWMGTGKAQAETQLPLVSSEFPLVDEIVDETIPPLPVDPEDPPVVGDVVQALPPVSTDLEDPEPVSTIIDDVDPVATAADAPEGIPEEGSHPGHPAPSAKSKKEHPNGKLRSVSQADESDGAVGNDLAEVAAAGQQIEPAQVLSETATPNQGSALSVTGFGPYGWIGSAALLMAAGMLCWWAARRARCHPLEGLM